MTLASRAVARRTFSLATLADLSEHLLDRRLGERWSLLGGYRDPEGSSLDNPDLAWKRFDFDLSLLDRDLQHHPGKDPSLVTDRFGEDKPAGRVDGRLNGIPMTLKYPGAGAGGCRGEANPPLH